MSHDHIPERVIAAGWMILGVVAFVATSDIQITESARDPWGPRVFPQVVAVFLFSGGAWLLAADLVSGRRARRAEGVGAQDEDGPAQLGIDEEQVEATDTTRVEWNARTAKAILLVLAYGIAMPFLGYIPSTLVVSVGMMLMMGVRRPVFIGVYSLALTLVVYGVFGTVLGIQLP